MYNIFGLLDIKFIGYYIIIIYFGSLILIDLLVGLYSIRNLILVFVEYVKMKKTIGYLWIKNVLCELID